MNTEILREYATDSAPSSHIGGRWHPLRAQQGLRRSGLSLAARSVWVTLVAYAGDDGRCWPGQARIAVDIGASVRTVRTAVRELEAAGWIRTTQRARRPLLYHLLTGRDPTEQGPRYLPPNRVGQCAMTGNGLPTNKPRSNLRKSPIDQAAAKHGTGHARVGQSSGDNPPTLTLCSRGRPATEDPRTPDDHRASEPRQAPPRRTGGGPPREPPDDPPGRVIPLRRPARAEATTPQTTPRTRPSENAPAGESEAAAIPCPEDLTLADSAIANLEMGIGVTRAAVARITLQFVLAEQEAPGNPRPIRAWRRCLLRAVTEDGPRIQRKINRERAAEDRDAELDRHYSDLRQADHYRRQHERYGGSNRSRDPAPPRPIADTGDGLSAYLERMARKRS